MNTGGKYGGEAFKKTVGLNGVGVKAVNMLSSEFTARSVRDGEARTVTFSQGIELTDRSEAGVGEPTGTYIRFRVDRDIRRLLHHNMEYVEQMVKNYTYLNLGLTITLNGKAYVENGLLDLVNDNISRQTLEAVRPPQASDVDAHNGAARQRRILRFRQRPVYAARRTPAERWPERSGRLPAGCNPAIIAVHQSQSHRHMASAGAGAGAQDGCVRVGSSRIFLYIEATIFSRRGSSTEHAGYISAGGRRAKVSLRLQKIRQHGAAAPRK